MDGANSSFGKRLGWETSRNEQLLPSEQGCHAESREMPISSGKHRLVVMGCKVLA